MRKPRHQTCIEWPGRSWDGGRAAVFVVTLTLLLVVTLPAAGRAEADSLFTADETSSQQFTSQFSRFEVKMFNGYIQVAVGNDKTTRVEITKRGSGRSRQEAQDDIKNIEVKMVQAGGTLRITGRRTDGETKSNSGAMAKLRVPAGALLDLQTSNDEVTSEGPVGSITAETSNGAIRVKAAKGPLKLTTSNGPIKVEGGSGRLTVETSNDGIDIAADQVVVSATTSNSPIRYAGALAKGNHLFSTNNDDIDLILPRSAKFSVDAETSNSEITCGFPVSATEQSDDVLKGTVGANPPMALELRTSNGNIHLLRGQ